MPSVLSKCLFALVAAPFLLVGSAFIISTLRSSLQGFGKEFEEESREAMHHWFGGQPKWLTRMFDPVTGYVNVLYRHPIFHTHVWLGFIWFLLGPLQLLGPRVLGADRHRQLGIALLAAFTLTLLVHQRSFSVPYRSRDPSLPAFFSAASIFTVIHIVCAIMAIRRGDVEHHQRHMMRAWFGTFMPIVGARVVVSTIFPRFLNAEDFSESLIPTTGWTLYSATQLALTLYFESSPSKQGVGGGFCQ